MFRRARFAARFASILFSVIVVAMLLPLMTEAGTAYYTTAGTSSFTVPTYTSTLVVEIWGGGGGGRGFDGNGGNGGQSSFNTSPLANGGGGGQQAAGGAGGTASGGDTNTSGGDAHATSGAGGNSPNGGVGGGVDGSGNGIAGTAPGGGGGGDGGGGVNFRGGGGGGYSKKTYNVGDLTPGTSITVIVGAAGTAGSGVGGAAGAVGRVAITWDTLSITTSTNVTGSASVGGTISKGSGTFVIDHPLDPKNKLLYHSFLESPDIKNIYDGVAVLDKYGEATIELPRYFLALNKDFRYLATPIREAMPDLHLKRGVRREWFFGKPTFRIAGGKPGGEISWQVSGIRKDPYVLKNPITVEVEKGGNQLMPPGTCLFEPLCPAVDSGL